MRLARAAAFLLALPASAGTAGAQCPPGPEAGSRIAAEDIVLAWRAVPEPITVGRHFALDVTLCGTNGTKGIDLLKVDATMPEHRHGMNYRAQARRLGDGRYRVEGMMFHMAGRWEMVFEVKSARSVLRMTQDVRVD